jgi:mycofactocin precursor
MPPDMTCDEWRRQRSARVRPVPCDHVHDSTSRYDRDRGRLTFLLVCAVCRTEKVIETLQYEPRFQPSLRRDGAAEPSRSRNTSRKHHEGDRAMPTGPDATPAAPAVTATAEPEESLVEDDRELVQDDLLVEDVSIDGMCGVY